ncbi:conserved Plasmodium protein, unknown function [Plasmodium berghei]|uniref:Uncharacterized protein n=2 Tax=Plasmodium berghei TaxID=5821 RepID=A0A509AK14_PLABA|nr:conserved Plasmodium protein, unknown function [Plasmodium berghei ANKA]SCM20564.1 conserved Plasmodium protein, unknown function [Plasmodium berghei]SCN24148.1 conserved Plasmodium protein, unknown function [Plasmodium berghei]SCO60647.1 conserved Plasmodium protein, unknown function [Plasmodium berghei]VUC55136.1 conserved Plasmodium protein, unknown function [Plasmodium berghei ANKA]|eukprot:XP_034420955.1 conserved Plasmodium protein, unknown function [Plasmodium berghei ANKA]
MLQNNLKNKKKNIKNGENKVNNVNKKTKALAKKTILNKKKIEKSPTILRWIYLLRNLKLNQLKKNIDDEMNNYEINKNINNKMLLFLNDDLEKNIILEKIEDLKNSSINVLIDIHKENINNMEKQFENEIKKLFKNFEDDQEILKKNKNSIVHKINIFYNKMEENRKGRKNNLEKDEQDIMDEIYKNNIAEKHISNYNFKKIKEENDKTFNDLLIENKRALNDEDEKYNLIKIKYEKNQNNLLSKEKEVHDLELKIDNWKLKLENEVKIYGIQIERLRKDKTQLLNHIRTIKLILQKLKHNDKQRLIDITSNSSKCIKKLEENIVLANKLISTNNLCRKYETEREKLFSCLSLEDPKKEDITIEEEKDKLFSNNNLKEKKICLFDNFFKRKNKVVLDIIILKKELKYLKKKNKEYKKNIDEMEDKLNLNRTVKFKKEDFIIRPS